MQSLTYILIVVSLTALKPVASVNLRNDPVSVKLQARQSAEIAPTNATNATNLLLHRATEEGNHQKSARLEAAVTRKGGSPAPAPPRRRRVACPAGQKGPRPSTWGACTLCGQGMWANAGWNHCQWCAVGLVSAAGSASCSACQSGKYKTGANVCTNHQVCAPGYYKIPGDSTTNTQCIQCEVGHFSSTGQGTVCTPCIAGQYQGNPGQDSCTSCGGGTVSQTGAVGCSACAAGKAAQPDAAMCMDCNAGNYAGPGASSCQSCPAGKHAPNKGMSACVACSAGTATGPGKTKCDSCLPGTFSVTQAAVCTGCHLGTFNKNAGASKCLPCEKGTFVSSRGQQECELAPRGSYVETTESHGADTCSPGTNQSQMGQSSCPTCPSGFFAEEVGSQYCEPWTTCDIGKETAQIGGTVSDTVCKDCDPGTYSDDESQCKLCPRGWATPDAGAGRCNFCGDGQQVANASKIEGNIGCSSCPAGKKSSSTEAQVEGGAQLACNDCIAGKFAGEEGADSCTFCPHGKYADTTGVTVCTSCPKGKFQTQTGTTECVECAAGKFMDITSSWKLCEACEIQFYSDAGAAQCTACPGGKTATTTGSSVCEACGGSTATQAPSTAADMIAPFISFPNFDLSNFNSIETPKLWEPSSEQSWDGYQ